MVTEAAMVAKSPGYFEVVFVGMMGLEDSTSWRNGCASQLGALYTNCLYRIAVA